MNQIEQDILKIVNKASEPGVALSQACDYLSRFDSCHVETTDKTYRLQFDSTRSVEIGKPYDDAGGFELIYNLEIADWDCKARMFRTAVESDHPKLMFVALQNATYSESRLKSQVLDRVRLYLDKYRGDEDQFVYRLGLDLGAVGHMANINGGAHSFGVFKGGGIYSTGINSVPDFELWFSRATTPLGMPFWKFGWVEPHEYHLYTLDNEGISACQKDLERWSSWANAFLEPLIAINWK